jgi:hypothetical protein
MVVASGKVSNGSMTKVMGCVLLLLVHEASERKSVVVGGVVCPLAVKASSGGIPAMGGPPAQAKVGQVSGGGTIKMTRG